MSLQVRFVQNHSLGNSISLTVLVLTRLFTSIDSLSFTGTHLPIQTPKFVILPQYEAIKVIAPLKQHIKGAGHMVLPAARPSQIKQKLLPLSLQVSNLLPESERERESF